MDPVEWIVDGAAWRAVAAHLLLMEVVPVKILQMIEGMQHLQKKKKKLESQNCSCFQRLYTLL